MEINDLSNLWGKMEAEKGTLIERSREYSRWTVSSIMPEEGEETEETRKGNVMSGARMVNHLANRVIDVLFPISRAFFTLALTPETDNDLTASLNETEVRQAKKAIQESTSSLERAAMRELKLTEYRPVAINTAKHLIVTGNALLRRMPSGARVMYSVDRYGVRLDAEGREFEVLLCDKKIFHTFDQKTQDLILAVKPETKEDTEVILYTRYFRKSPKARWEVTQEANGVPLKNDHKLSAKDYDLLILNWYRNPGEHYGRGLVEDNAALFHNIDVSTTALINMIGIAADIKFLVRIGSPLAMDIQELNDSPAGSYFPGDEGDITVPEVADRGNMETIARAIQEWDQTLAQIFLLSSVRDAERVTAEEIRLIAGELESSFGGLYSQLAQSWQQKEAEFAISKLNIPSVTGGAFEVLVTTGLESLSREGKMDNLRLAIADLQMLEVVPEGLQAAIHPLRFMAYVLDNRGVSDKSFLNSEDEMKANQQAALEEAGRLQGQQAEANVAEHAGKAAVDGQN